MSDDAALLHVSFVTKLDHDSKENGNSLETAFDVRCSWRPVIDSPETRRKDYALVFLNVNVKAQSVAENAGTKYEQSAGLKDMLTTVQSSTPLIPGTSWSGRILLVVPMRPGYLARTKCFQQRFTGCMDLGLLHDRTVFGQGVDIIHSQKPQALLDGCVFMLVRPGNHSHLSDDASVVEEVHARINFQWLLNDQPTEKTLAVVDGHLNLQSYLPFYNSARALGIKFVLLDSPEHWITDSSLRHLYQDFIPIDMTPNDGFHVRIATAVKAYGHVDGICAIASYCLLPVAKAAAMLGLPAELPEAVACAVNKYDTRLLAGGAEPTALVADVPDLKNRMAKKEFIPQYPLIVKPGSGTGSAHVYKADTEAELLEGVRRTCEGSSKKALIEAYIDGPELDVNFVLLDGEIIFFEIADDFPSPGDNGTIDSDFWENTNVLPSKLPANEYAVVRENLHQLLLKMGLKTGVFHLEGRVQNSSLAYSETDGLIDLRPRSNIAGNQAPRCFLIEVNPRPPGMPCVLTTAGSYGVNMYDLHLLASVGDYERFRALARPFELDTVIPNHARAWSQLVWLRAAKGGICASDDVCGEFLRRLSPDDRALVTESVCFFRRGQRIPEPKQGVVLFGAFFIVTSKRNRHDVLRVSRVLQEGFSIPCQSVTETMLSARGADWAKVGFLHGREDAYDPVHNPDGIVWLGNAQNWLINDDLSHFINTHNHFDRECCTYGEGYTGTLRLRTAMARHLVEYFQPVKAIDPEEITFAAGVTNLNEVCSLVTCDPGDYIMVGRPAYGPFSKDLCMRTGVKLEWVSVGDTDQFSPACVAAYDAGFEAAKSHGRKIKALMICNPHNPLGQCYPPETLVALLHLCAAKGIHLISDEIYALSTYNRDDRPSEKFTSIRAIDYSGFIDPCQVHVLYGMSKDYGGAGLRLGCLITQNSEFSKAARAICRFSSPSQFSMDLAAKFLEDRSFVQQFLQKSHRLLLQSRLLTEDLLAQNGIKYHQKGNAGLFIWLDLSPYLPLDETDGDGWAAERKLSQRFKQAGVLMDAGEDYYAPYPGRFRLMFTVKESTLREGIRRILSVLLY